MLTLFFNSLIALLSLSTAVGVLVHDMHIDTVAAAALAAPNSADSGKVPLAADPHTHTEKHSMSRLFGSQVPSVQPRRDEDKKHLLQNHVRRGYHPFDNYNLPLA